MGVLYWQSAGTELWLVTYSPRANYSIFWAENESYWRIPRLNDWSANE